MCRKFVLVSSLEKIETRFQVHINPHTLPIPASYAVCGGDSSYVITSENPYEIQVMKFGMTPYWAKAPMELINARAEGEKNQVNDPYYNGSNAIFLKAAFKKPIQSQRCLVLAEAYYEWSSLKKPYLVYLRDKERPLGFAGVFDRWKDPVSGEMLVSFAIITTTANSLLQSIGVKRMPVILTRSNGADWIKSTRHLSEVLKMLNPFPPEMMNAFPVSDRIETSGTNNVSLVNPIGEKLQSEVQPTYLKRPYRMHNEKLHSDTPWFENRK
jgi:putative SOS response-associated peptidase YedK